jgi:hypothetical protein
MLSLDKELNTVRPKGFIYCSRSTALALWPFILRVNMLSASDFT